MAFVLVYHLHQVVEMCCAVQYRQLTTCLPYHFPDSICHHQLNHRTKQPEHITHAETMVDDNELEGLQLEGLEFDCPKLLQ